MGSTARTKKNQPLQCVAKNFAALLGLILIFALGVTSSCSSSPKHEPNLSPNKEISITPQVTALGTVITTLGDNFSPSFSADDKKIIYISKQRPSHTQAQIYLFDLNSKKERRITYQDGDCSQPVFLKNNQHFLYASTTDELKERPLLLYKKSMDSSWPHSELYMSDLTGVNIDRLTRSEGYDGSPSVLPNQDSIITYAKSNRKNIEAWQMNYENRKTFPVLRKKGISILSLKAATGEKKWVWVEQLDDGTTQVLVTEKGLRGASENILPNLKWNYRQALWWNPDRLILNAKTNSPESKFQLYTYTLSTKCLQLLAEAPADILDPSLNEDATTMVFSSMVAGNSQILMKNLADPTGACLQ